MLRFLPPFLLTLTIAITAPLMGRIRDLLFDALGSSAVRGLAISLAATLAALLIFGVSRIRHRRLPRYALLVLVVILLWLQTQGFSLGIPQSDVAEKIHIVEYGLLAFLLYRGFRPTGDPRLALLPLLWILVAGTLDEGVQWYVPGRLGEIRDVWINFFAGLSGLLFALALAPPARFAWRLSLAARKTVARTAALALLAVGLFFYVAHLGHEIEDPEIGRFRSWFTVDELHQISVQRARSWTAEPPTELAVWAHEDYFLTEAAWHTNHRNASYEHGLWFLAWQANRILEKYYDPFLDLRSFQDGSQHRYPPKVRQELEAKARDQGDPTTYLSPVLVKRIYPWPSKKLFLAVLLAMVLLVGSFSELQREPGNGSRA